MLAQVAGVIELAGLQVGIVRADLRQGGFAQDVGGHVLDGGTGNFVDETSRGASRNVSIDWRLSTGLRHRIRFRSNRCGAESGRLAMLTG